MADHFEVTAGVDMEAYCHYEDSVSAPVQPVRVGFEPYTEDWGAVLSGWRVVDIRKEGEVEYETFFMDRLFLIGNSPSW